MTARANAGVFDVAIVGGGFSGVMVALNAARARLRTRIVIVERGQAPGRGTAYAERPHDAILNVPAGAMGAFSDDPGGFVRWLGAVDPAAFLPRNLYGRYLQALLADAQARGATIVVAHADVADLRPGPAGRILLDGDGDAIATATAVVLALGAPRPADIVAGMPASVREHRAYIADPWAFLRAPAFAPAGDILIAGSGLTALDVVAAFARTGGTNRLHVVSRRGRFPLAHVTAGNAVPAAPIPPGERPATIREIVARVRRAVRAAAMHGHDWRSVMDGLRPGTADLWSGLDLVERRRFLRHVRPLFDPHRHRAPVALLALKDRLVQRDGLSLSAARIVALQTHGDAIDVELQPRGGTEQRTLRVVQLINCGGPGNDYATDPDALIANLIARRAICADPTGLGLRALPDGRLLDAAGTINSNLFTIGWPMRGTLFETTAVRELRDHAAALGASISSASHNATADGS